jgi:hypothetical protein
MRWYGDSQDAQVASAISSALVLVKKVRVPGFPYDWRSWAICCQRIAQLMIVQTIAVGRWVRPSAHIRITCSLKLSADSMRGTPSSSALLIQTPPCFPLASQSIGLKAIQLGYNHSSKLQRFLTKRSTEPWTLLYSIWFNFQNSIKLVVFSEALFSYMSRAFDEKRYSSYHRGPL